MRPGQIVGLLLVIGLAVFVLLGGPGRSEERVKAAALMDGADLWELHWKERCDLDNGVCTAIAAGIGARGVIWKAVAPKLRPLLSDWVSKGECSVGREPKGDGLSYAEMHERLVSRAKMFFARQKSPKLSEDVYVKRFVGATFGEICTEIYREPHL